MTHVYNAVEGDQFHVAWWNLQVHRNNMQSARTWLGKFNTTWIGLFPVEELEQAKDYHYSIQVDTF